MKGYAKTITRRKLSDFILSEDGSVSKKTSLTVGALISASALAQFLLTPKASADIDCDTSFPDCGAGGACCQTFDGQVTHQHCTTTEACVAMGGTIL